MMAPAWRACAEMATDLRHSLAASLSRWDVGRGCPRGQVTPRRRRRRGDHRPRRDGGDGGRDRAVTPRRRGGERIDAGGVADGDRVPRPDRPCLHRLPVGGHLPFGRARPVDAGGRDRRPDAIRRARTHRAGAVAPAPTARRRLGRSSTSGRGTTTAPAMCSGRDIGSRSTCAACTGRVRAGATGPAGRSPRSIRLPGMARSARCSGLGPTTRSARRIRAISWSQRSRRRR